MPTSIANIYFKGWKDEEGLMSAFAGIAKNTGSVNAFTTESRALGHKKGEAKSSQTVTNIRRDVKAKIIYKKLPLDLQDILDDQDGELLAFRSNELRDRIVNEVIVSAIVGDGRSAGTPDNRTFDGTRGLFSMKADLDNSVNSGTFASVVATKISNVETDNNYDKAVKTIAGVENDGMGGRIILCATKGFIRDMKIAKDDNDAYLFPLGTNFNDVLGADVYEMPAMEGCGYDCIAFKAGSYVLFGNEDFEFSDYDLDYNQDVLLREKSVAGSLQGNKVCAGYVSANASA